MRKRIADDQGLTLIELMIAMAVTTIVVLIALSGLAGTQKAENVSDQDSRALATLRVATQRLTRELRNAAKVYTGSTGKQIEFWVDYDRTGDQDDSERIIWRLDNAGGRGVLKRTTRAGELSGATPDQWAEDLVYADAFSYNTSPPRTSLVTVTLSADVAPNSGVPARSVKTDVRLRDAPT